MLAFRCPHCGADISYEPGQESVKCQYCESVINIEEYENSLSKEGYYTTNELSCTQCGAVIYSTDTTMATFCSYCGSSVLLRNRIVKEKKPEYIIPFSVKKEKAAEIYKDRIDRILLAPKWMDEEGKIENFRGIYMPFHLLKYSAHGNYSGEGTESTIITEKKKKYDVVRKYAITNAPVDIDYDFIPVDASSSFPDSISRAICPYTKSKLKEFKESYLAGFYADSSDVPPELYTEKYEAMVKRDIASKSDVMVKKAAISTADIANQVQLTAESHSSLLPVWFLSYRNKKRINYAAINGETGELVADVPIDFKKYLAVSLVIAAFFSIILNIFFTINPHKFLVLATFVAFAAFCVANSLLNDTYRRLMHYDDAGYLGRNADKVKEKHYHKKKSHLFLWIFVFCTGFGVLTVLSEEFLWMSFAAVLYIPVGVILLIVSVLRNQGRTGGVIREKKAPFVRKLLTLIKPMLAMILALYVGYTETVNDMVYYTAGIFSIIMIILTAFDVVRIQNRFTMRDIPLFTERRGGDM
ncbi:MAG: zinc ribbon domain-containing protein [Lachnospiraceae bacterium]|nr:zinc ribbon domain-containing protein [Lachnospiraceae bacterium]